MILTRVSACGWSRVSRVHITWHHCLLKAMATFDRAWICVEGHLDVLIKFVIIYDRY
jgi:hypothetical protein